MLSAAQVLLSPAAPSPLNRPGASAFSSTASASTASASTAISAASAFEVLAAALAQGGCRAPPLNQGRYSYLEQPAVADCAEMCARELCNALLWDPAAQRFDESRIPPNASGDVRAFYAPDGPAYGDLRRLHEGDTHSADGDASTRGE